MSYIKIYIHCIWSTKNRIRSLTSSEIRNQVWKHIRENAKKKQIFIDSINGYQEHCHCLISLGNDQNIKDVVQHIKGESSHWINKNNLCDGKFAWQSEYSAYSVSPLGVKNVRSYIWKQEEHHRHTTFEEEYQDFLVENNFGLKPLH